VLSSQIAGKPPERIRETNIPITTIGQDAAGAIRAALTERELEIFTLLVERQEQSADRTRTLAQHKDRLEPHQKHPRQTPP